MEVLFEFDVLCYLFGGWWRSRRCGIGCICGIVEMKRFYGNRWLDLSFFLLGGIYLGFECVEIL